MSGIPLGLFGAACAPDIADPVAKTPKTAAMARHVVAFEQKLTSIEEIPFR
jgi:hypothetical protein